MDIEMNQYLHIVVRCYECGAELHVTDASYSNGDVEIEVDICECVYNNELDD
jgi:hypothetical protein